MTIFTALIEGAGDEAALPALISRATTEIGQPVFSPHPIKVGSWQRLKKPGQLERFVELGMRPGVDGVVVSLDLDDGCPKREALEIESRRAALEMRFGKPVKIVLCYREYETWFLTQLDHLRLSATGYSWDPEYTCADPEAHRNAKGCISKAIRKPYKETSDQLRLTRGLDWRRLAIQSRSFRKLLKDILALDTYEQLEEFIR